MEYFRARYDGLTITMTTIGLVFPGVWILVALIFVPLWFWAICALLLSGSAFLSYKFSLRGFSVGRDGLRIDRRIGPLVIPLEAIRSARRAAPNELWWLLNLWASQGAFGFRGWFWSPHLGHHRAYVTNQSDMVLVVAEQPYLLSPENPEEFLRALARHIPRWADISTKPMK